MKIFYILLLSILFVSKAMALTVDYTENSAQSQLTISLFDDDGMIIDSFIVPKLDNTKIFANKDPELDIPGGLTLDAFGNIAKAKNKEVATRLIRLLFKNYGVNLECTPQGKARGRAGRVFKPQLSKGPDLRISSFLTYIAETSWKGKEFIELDSSCQNVTGNNFVWKQNRINFVARTIPSDSIEKRVKGLSKDNLVPTSSAIELDYSNSTKLWDHTKMGYISPATGFFHPMDFAQQGVTWLMSTIVQQLGVYDLAVAIPGKGGFHLLGLTWLGHYGPHQEGPLDQLNPFEIPETGALSDIIATFFLKF